MIERAVITAARELRARGEDHLVATVVAVSGSAYRRPGARMVATRERWIAGSVSGGCLEGDVQRTGWWRTEGGGPVVVRYDSSDGELNGCGGIVDVMIERGGTAGVDPITVAADAIRHQRRAAIVTVFRSDERALPIGTRLAVTADGEVAADVGDSVLRAALLADARATIPRRDPVVRAHGPVEALIEPIAPPPRLFVLGAGHDARPLADLARTVGWEVVIAAPHARPAIRERFAGCDVVFGPPRELAALVDASDRAAVVVMNHHVEQDVACVAAMLATRACYIGVLGAYARTAALFAALGRTRGDDPRIHAPVGLELGAETPAEIALAIVAEVQAVLAASPASRLREHLGPIHARSVAARR